MQHGRTKNERKMTIYEVEETDFDDGFDYMVAENRDMAPAKPGVILGRGSLAFKSAPAKKPPAR